MYHRDVRFLLPPDRGAVRGPARAAILSDWLTAWLGEPVTAKVAPSYHVLADSIERGDVDVAWSPPAVCARVHRSTRSMLTAVRYGATECRAALVVRTDAGIRSVRELRKMRASWVDPLSTSGHLMALAHLRDEGLEPMSLFSSQRFAGSYRDALADVAERRADVTSVFVVDDTLEATLHELHDLLGPRARDLSLLSMTAAAPFDALVVSKKARDAVEDKLLSLDQRISPPAMLLEVCRADRFIRARARAYARLESMVDAYVDRSVLPARRA
jgi:ABC-type phosphate/phosphonate transport system substrate-binding protein